MFRDTPNGTTHHFDDGCVPPHLMVVDEASDIPEEVWNQAKAKCPFPKDFYPNNPKINNWTSYSDLKHHDVITRRGHLGIKWQECQNCGLRFSP